MKKSSIIKIIIPCVAVVLAGVGIYLLTRPQSELRTVSSEAELYSFYEQDSSYVDSDNPILRLLLMPFSIRAYSRRVYYDIYDDALTAGDVGAAPQDTSDSLGGGGKDFSTTNIQVKNVDEADIVKTDGDYTYSISGPDVVITDVRDTANPQVAAHIESSDNAIPEDLIISDDILTIIGTEYNGSTSGFRGRDFYSSYYGKFSSRNNTIVRVYDISNRTAPSLKKSYALYEPYYTSRRIGDKLYVIASGPLRKKSGENLVEHNYSEDSVGKEFPVNSIHYLEEVLSDDLTLISVLDLSNPSNNIVIEPFLLDISNAYVSESAFYLIEESYFGSDLDAADYIKSLFGLKGVFGFFEQIANNLSSPSGRQTEIYKFNIEDSGKVSYAATTTVSGTTINQYSLDESNGHLRIALEESDGSYIAIFDDNLNKIGESERLGENEKMYASRFIGDKAYLVTYRNTDPLFVVDLADESSPKALGELKIPGYSVYLHPYDENYLIGIGIDTTEETRKDINGRVISTSVYITGMKLALFDISDFNNPKEISKLHIGDAYTTSAILTNPKALLFSKEKHLLGIPVNGYESEFKIDTVGDLDNISTLTDYFEDYDDNYIEEGYIVYSISPEDGIQELGEVIHEDSNLVRGIYIDNDLLTISDNMLKVNSLQDLQLKAKLNLTKEK